MYYLRQTQYLKYFKSVMLYVTWKPEPTARPSCLYGFLSPLKINKRGVCYVHHTNCREWRYYFKRNFSQWIIFWKWQNYVHLYASTRILKNLLTCSLEYFYLFFLFFFSEISFSIFQKLVDINAAVQALIESNAALQMEVMNLTVFTLSFTYTIIKRLFEEISGLL